MSDVCGLSAMKLFDIEVPAPNISNPPKIATPPQIDYPTFLGLIAVHPSAETVAPIHEDATNSNPEQA